VGEVWRLRQVVDGRAGAFLPRRAAAVVVAPDAGFLAGSLLDAAGLAGDFFAVETTPDFLAGALFLAGGVVVGAAPQASAAMAKAAAQVRIVRMSKVIV
jgi:hypothetical protein